MLKLATAAAAAAACVCLTACYAHAQAPTTADIVSAVCADKSTVVYYLDWGARAVGAASLIALARNKIPAPILGVVDAVALNWIKSKTAPKA